jgi:phospholipid:diacylglycerol acyltransferase
MSDTIFMGTVGDLVEQFIGRQLRRDLWTTWGSLWTMLPKGGDDIWSVGADFKERVSSVGDDATDSSTARHDIETKMLVMTDSDDDEACEESGDQHPFVDTATDGHMNEAMKKFASRKSHGAGELVDFLLNWGGGLGPNISPARDHSFNHKDKASKTTWHDVTRTPLPHAPNMKIYCLYGVGIDTERAYHYKLNPGEVRSGGANNSVFPWQPIDSPFVLDTSVEDPENNIVHGVKYTDGDASVPLLSLGYMCGDAWRRKETGLNPSKTKVITREYKHRQEFSVDDPMRAGPYSADHVDILGNVDFMEDFMKIVSDYDIDTVEDKIVSDILNIGKRLHEHPKGGLKKRRRWPF